MGLPTLLPLGHRRTNLLFMDAEMHSHFYWEFTIFTNGTCKNTINGTEYTVSEDYLTILGPNHIHSIISTTPVHAHRDIFISSEELEIICKDLFCESLYERLSNPDNPVILQLQHPFSKELESFLSLIDVAYAQNQDSDKTDPLIRSVLIFLLSQVFLQDTIAQHGTASWLSAQLGYLQQPAIFCQNIDDIIKSSGYSHSQYLRKFKEATGIPLIQYLMNLRIDHAKSLLLSTQKSVLEISYEVGYDSVNYFIRTFKARTGGMTPLQYRLKKKKQ